MAARSVQNAVLRAQSVYTVARTTKQTSAQACLAPASASAAAVTGASQPSDVKLYLEKALQSTIWVLSHPGNEKLSANVLSTLAGIGPATIRGGAHEDSKALAELLPSFNDHPGASAEDKYGFLVRLNEWVKGPVKMRARMQKIFFDGDTHQMYQTRNSMDGIGPATIEKDPHGILRRIRAAAPSWPLGLLFQELSTQALTKNLIVFNQDLKKIPIQEALEYTARKRNGAQDQERRSLSRVDGAQGPTAQDRDAPTQDAVRKHEAPPREKIRARM